MTSRGSIDRRTVESLLARTAVGAHQAEKARKDAIRLALDFGLRSDQIAKVCNEALRPVIDPKAVAR